MSFLFSSAFALRLTSFKLDNTLKTPIPTPAKYQGVNQGREAASIITFLDSSKIAAIFSIEMLGKSSPGVKEYDAKAKKT